MKKLILILLALALAAAVGLAVFLARFDADRYRPMVTRKMEEVLGRPVKMGKISLVVRRGIALEARDLAVYPEAAPQGEPEAQAERVYVALKIRPLLRGELEVSTLTVKGGVLRFADRNVRPPIEVEARDVELSAANLSVTRSGSASVEDLSVSGKIGKGSFSVKGAVRGIPAQAAGTFQAQAENIALEELLPAARPGEPALDGLFSGSFAGEFQGMTPPELTRTLSGDGRIRLDNAVMSNMNILREVFDRISLIPGLTQALLARLPESYREKLDARDTRFELIDLTVNIREGTVFFPNARVATDSFALAGSGQCGFDGTLRFPAQVEIEPKLSGALIRSVEELRALADAQGSIGIPVLAQGKLPDISVAPDVNYLAARLVTSKAEEFLGDLLQKVLEKQEE